jgi:hypothetical protein
MKTKAPSRKSASFFFLLLAFSLPPRHHSMSVMNFEDQSIDVTDLCSLMSVRALQQPQKSTNDHTWRVVFFVVPFFSFISFFLCLSFHITVALIALVQKLSCHEEIWSIIFVATTKVLFSPSIVSFFFSLSFFLSSSTEKADNFLHSIAGSKPHICNYPGCNKSFLRPAHLTIHNRIHTGEVSAFVLLSTVFLSYNPLVFFSLSLSSISFSL